MNYNKELNVLTNVLAIYSNTIKCYPVKDNQLMPERNLLEKDLHKLASLLDNKSQQKQYHFKGIIPNNVLNFKHDALSITWTTKAKFANLLFIDALPIENGNYPIPNLIWSYNEPNLNVYAVKSNRVTLNTPLYQAPFLNVDNFGSVCLGSINFNNLPNDYERVITAIEDAFYNSYFTHTNCDNLINGNIAEFYNTQINSKTPFDNNLLVETNLKIKDLV